MPKVRVEKEVEYKYPTKRECSQNILGYPLYDIKSISLQNGDEIFLNKRNLEAAQKAKQGQRPAIKSSIHLEDSKIVRATNDLYVISRVRIVRTNGSTLYQEGIVLMHSSIAWISFYDPTNVLNLPIIEWSEAYDQLKDLS